MTNFMLSLIVCCSCIQAFHAHGVHERSNESPQDKKTVKVNIPNLLNILPNFDKIFSDFDFGTPRKAEDGKDETPIRRHMKNIRDIDQNVRGALKSALNLQENDTDLLDVELANKGSKTQLNMRSPLGQLSIDATASDKGRERNPDDIKPVSRKPINEYMRDVIKDQAKRFEDFTLNILGPRTPDGTVANMLSLANKRGKTNMDFTAPVFPVKVSVASQGLSEQRKGWFPEQNPPMNPDQTEDWDPEVEYNHLVDQQKRNYMQMRSHGGSLQSEPQQTATFPPTVTFPAGISGKRLHHFEPSHFETHHDPHHHHGPMPGYAPYPGMQRYPHSHPYSDPYWNTHFMHREGFFGLPANPQRIPIEDFAQSRRFVAPNFGQMEQMIGSYVDSNTWKQNDSEDNSAEQYIEDLKKATDSLGEDTKEKLRIAFKDFKKSLDAMEPEDSEENEVKTSWLPRRVVDERDLEIAFLNIDKDSDEKPNPSDGVVVAFTLTGVPLKIYMDSHIENPVQVLHEVLAAAGITLNIPVSSFETMEPVGDILYIGAGNIGNEISQAVSLEVEKFDDIKKSVNRFLGTRETQLDQNSEKAIIDALHDAISSGELKFSEALQGNFERNPVQVLADIVTYMSDDSPKSDVQKEPEETLEG